MSISPNNKKLEKYLDELADEYKTLLFNALVSRSQSLEDLNISELLRIDNEIKKPLIEGYQRQQKRRRTLLLAGMTYMLFGFFMFTIYQVAFVQSTMGDTISLVSLIIGFMGIFISVLSFALPTLRMSPPKGREGTRDELLALSEYKVVAKWRELEGTVNDINIDSSVKTPRSIIEYLMDNHFINDNEYNILRDFLKMRNNVVHSTDISYSSNEIREGIDKIDKVINKINKIM